ncbi:YdcF family protein [Granulicella sp. L60]|uniref:YdcF family protein n=1 Tax=Granulicella sp. L60 TaxID=1641866 RepID=UPI00131C7514|nr:YdcF family protein [Granulicella sp. L60]
MYLRRLLAFFLAVTALAPHSFAEVSPVKKPLPLHAAIQDKNFYLLSLFQTNSVVRKALASDKILSQINTTRQQHLKSATQTCQQSLDCVLQPLIWTDEEIKTVSSALTRIYQTNAHIRKIIDSELQSSGTYVLYQQQGDQDLLANAWTLCAHGINEVLEVYGEGTRPRYPKIDSISFDVHSSDFQQRIATLVAQTSEAKPQLFFEPSLKTALQLLALNHRDEAARFEAMEETVNKTALTSIPSTHWDNFPFSVIVVPGEGPEDPNVALAEIGRKRTALAAQAYHDGKAPFILVSGGYVHPSQTHFAEAIEMKKALLNDYHVPEEAILVDPHARHTTTNMRNAAREIYRYNMPMSKPALVVSDPAQTTYIQSQILAERCRKELGYLPYQIVTRPSDTSLVFLPAIDSLQQNPLDPLDP